MSRFKNRLLLIMLAPALLLVGCDDDAAGPGDLSSREQINQGLAGLASFGNSAAGDPGAQLLLINPDVAALAAIFGLDPGAFGTAKMPASASDIRAYQKAFINTGTRKKAVDFVFGTYAYDAQDASDPFPGWVLIDESMPADGMIFQWTDQDGFVVVDDMGMQTEVGGELRFLNVVVSDAGTPGDTADDIVTNMLFQLAIDDGTELVTAAQISFMVTLDEAFQPTEISIGDEENTADTFVGPISFAFHFGLTETDLSLTLQLVDTTTNYTVRLTADVGGFDPETGNAESVSATFAYGTTSDPTSPPWAITLTLSDFDPETQIAQVSGGITFQGTQLATFSGDTTEVTYEGGTCINVDVTFVETGGQSAGNICEVFPEFFGEVQGSLGGFGAPVNVWR